MAHCHLFITVLLSCVTQLFAVRSCDQFISAQVSAQPQAPVLYTTLFSGQLAYLVSASTDCEFAVTDTYYLDFNTACGLDTVIYKLVQTFTDGSAKCQTRAAYKDSRTEYYYEPGFDLYLNFFLCEGNLVVIYKCKPGECGVTLFLILATYGQTVDTATLNNCKATIADIYPPVTFKDMNYPTNPNQTCNPAVFFY